MTVGTVGEVVKAIEGSLALFWSTPSDGAVPKVRASTTNLVVLAPLERWDEAREQIEAVTETHAGRAFILGVDPKIAPWEVRGESSATCRVGGAVPVCHDRVELAFGAIAAERAGSIVRGLSLAEVPIVVDASLGGSNLLLGSLAAHASRVIVDSSRVPVHDLVRLVGGSGASLADRVLVRTFSFRELCARFFDGRADTLSAIERVVVGRTSFDHASACDPAPLVFGWLAGLLGWTFRSKSEATRADGGPVALFLHEDRRDDLGPAQLSSIEIETRHGGHPLTLSLSRIEGSLRSARWRMSGALAAEHVFPLGYRDEGWVLGRAIDAREGDRVTRLTLEAAARWEEAP